jgi:hypothetical protein
MVALREDPAVAASDNGQLEDDLVRASCRVAGDDGREHHLGRLADIAAEEPIEAAVKFDRLQQLAA